MARIDGIVISRSAEYSDMPDTVVAIVEHDSDVVPTLRLLVQRDVDRALEGYEPDDDRVCVRVVYGTQRVSSVI